MDHSVNGYVPGPDELTWMNKIREIEAFYEDGKNEY